MTTSRRIRDLLTARIVIVLFSVLFAGTAVAERWYTLWAGTFDARVAVELDSIAPAPEYPSAMAVWIYVHHGISTFDCSPPSNCFATSQLTHYYVDCTQMQAAVIRRVPMNLRGKVVETIDERILTWFPLVRQYHWYDRDEDDDAWKWNTPRRFVERRPTPTEERLATRHRGEVLVFCARYNAGAVNDALMSYTARP